MKTLYLIRHAKSCWENPKLADFDRPLNNRGKRDAPKMGKILAKQGVTPDLILTSPAARAKETCFAIAKELQYDPSKIKKKEDIFHADSFTLLGIINSIPNTYQSLMMFGHNPGFTFFANQLTNMHISNIPTCGVFCCTFDIFSWHDITLGSGIYKFFEYPKKQSWY